MEDIHTYPPTARSVRRARRRTAEIVAKWGYPGQADDAALLVGELASNAVRHGTVRGRLFRVEVALSAGALRVAVTDTKGEAKPRPRPREADAESGRGLLIVAALASRWDVEELEVGKRVWAELDLGGEAAAPGRGGRGSVPDRIHVVEGFDDLPDDIAEAFGMS